MFGIFVAVSLFGMIVTMTDMQTRHETRETCEQQLAEIMQVLRLAQQEYNFEFIKSECIKVN